MALENRTPLLVAVMYGSVDVVKLILSLSEADVNLSCGPDKSTALHCAASSGSVYAVDVVKMLLLASADHSLIDANGHRPIDVIVAPSKFPDLKDTLERHLRNDDSVHLLDIKVSFGGEKSNSSSHLSSPENGPLSSAVDSASSLNNFRLYDTRASSPERKEYLVNPSLPDIKNGSFMADHSKTAEYSQNPYGIIDDITHLSPCPSIYHSLHSPLKYTLLRLHKQTNKTERKMAPAESVVVVMDANHRKVSVEAVDWAIKHIVRPRDTVVVLGVLSEVGKKTTTSSSSSSSSSSCLPFHVGASLSRICKKNEVKLEVILAAGYDPCEKTIEQAQNYNTQWIVLDSHLKKHKAYIHGRVTCNIAVFKGKDVATLISSRTPGYKTDGKSVANVGVIAKEDDELQHEVLNPPPEKSFIPAPTTPPSPCWYPLSWRTGFPRAFSISELGEITNGFADSNIVVDEPEKKVYKGIYQETRVLIKLFSASDDRFWSLLKILSRVRHRNILNLVGYCCTDASLYLLCDYPCNGTVETNLLCDESAKRLSWRVRWYIALEIGIGLRYLHEECVDGPIADLSVCSTYVVFSSGSTVMLSIFNTAKWLKDDLSHNEDPPADLNAEEDKHLLADIHGYGLFLIELITGKSAQYFQKQAKGQSLIDWVMALPYLENGSLNQVMDPRVTDTSDTGVVSHMSRAALLCLKNDTAHKFSISEPYKMNNWDYLDGPIKLNKTCPVGCPNGENPNPFLCVLAVVRGDQFAVSNS
ncbi:unnamed protein product [Camellia sinensis]